MEVSSSTSTTLVSSDPVSSLRAAALSTLKSKRRKAAAVEKPAPAPLRPPPPTDSFQLDYGQEDNNQDVTKSDVAPPVSEVPETKEKSPIPTADVHMREEGEISDEEGPPTLPMQTDDRARKVPSKSVTPENIIHNFLEARPTPPLSPSPRSLTPEIQKLAARNLLQSQYSLPPSHQHQPTLMDRLSVPETFVPAFKQEEEIFDIPMLDTSEQYAADIGPDCVRPGLYLNQEDYDTVKDIILDLLGWGVPFEFLVDCGISKEVIYYVFNELELRLPDEFDTSGMIPYTAETIAQLQQTVLMPPPLPAQQRRDSIESSVSVKMDTSVKVVTPPAPPVTVSDAPSSVVESPQNTDLHDMERQRRQELLARKAAVQASRRQKQHVPSKPSVDILQLSDSIIVDHDNVEMAPYAATETVEDFLNSLSAVQGLEPTSKAIVTPETESIPMNVDQQDQSSHERTVELKERDQLESGLNSAVSEQFSVSSNHSLPFTEAPPSSTEPPPTSVGSSNSNFSYFSSSTPPTPVDILPRRGSKRPVAADFVDFDPAPKRHEHTSQIERMNGTGSITRRLTTGTTFQNINSRRCVIDLSDSEDDEDEPRQQSQPREDPIQQRRDKHAQLPRQFPSSAPIKSVPSGTLSPAALQLKELEIRKMRELIAKREEETRLRKLALARSASTTNVQNSVASTPITPHAPLKVEEVDVLISASAATPEQNRDTSHNLRSSESATPPVDTEYNAQPPNGTYYPGDTGITSGKALLFLFGQTAFSSTFLMLYFMLLCSNSSVTTLPKCFLVFCDTVHALDSAMTHQQHESAERSVDADQSPSPSTQTESLTPPPAHQKQNASMLEDSQSVNPNQTSPEKEMFSSYRSPFELYPRLRGVSETVSSASQSLSANFVSDMHPSSYSSFSVDSYSVDAKPSGSAHSSSVYRPDLKSLKLAALAKLLDPRKRLCRYEVPGGGTCRDDGCEDIHLSRLEGANQMGTIEPNDEDTADYLFDAMPQSWLRQNEVTSSSKILSALQEVHRKTVNTPLQFEDRVAQALDSLGSPPTT